MNQVTRQGAFETNSSSTHSIVIAGSDFVSSKLHSNDNDEIEAHGGEFGWGYDEFNDAETKLAYCVTYLMASMQNNIEQESFTKKDMEWLGFLGNTDSKLGMLVNVIVSETGKNIRFMKDTCDFHPWGYIDHDSDYVCGDAFESEESLRSFIFNPDSTLIIDGNG